MKLREMSIDEVMISMVWVMHGGKLQESCVYENTRHGVRRIKILGTTKLKKDDGQSLEVTGIRGHRHSWRNKKNPLTIHIDDIRVNGEWIQNGNLMPLGFKIVNKSQEESDGYCYQVLWT